MLWRIRRLRVELCANVICKTSHQKDKPPPMDLARLVVVVDRIQGFSLVLFSFSVYGSFLLCKSFIFAIFHLFDMQQGLQNFVKHAY